MKKTILLTILDGCGLRDTTTGNAFRNAHKPNFNYLWNNYPHAYLEASGTFVGLPSGQVGNSEVGHMNIGAGRVVYQPLERINQSIENKSFFQNEELLNVISHVKQNQSKLHIMGLISDGGVHSHINHLMAILELCKQQKIEKLYLHLFTDGRDTKPNSSYHYIEKVEEKLKEIGVGTIATISGRYYAMDRDNNYDRIKKSYDAIVKGIGPKKKSIKEYIEECYKEDITDEFLIPAIFDEDGLLQENDGIIVFNYRKDRLRELFTAITNPTFNDMEVIRFQNVKVVTMMPVVHSVLANHAFDDQNLVNTLGEYMESLGKKQLRIAETEKYAHVTFYFDGGKEVDYSKEKKVLIPSPKVATYDLKPEMSSVEVTDALLKELDEDYDLIVLNYANGDMLGHTGVYDAAIKGVEAVDRGLGRVFEKIKKQGGVIIVIADHGNCEEMIDEEGNICTSHTTSIVPFIITQKDIEIKNGKLADIAPTILDLMGLEIPKEMTGKSLIINKSSKK